MVKRKHPKNNDQRACLELSLLAVWRYAKFLWSVQTTKGCSVLSNKCCVVLDEKVIF